MWQKRMKRVAQRELRAGATPTQRRDRAGRQLAEIRNLILGRPDT
jgi:hypothetical protein